MSASEMHNLRRRLPQTSLQFKQMIDENINMDIEPNKFIQISTYIALQMTQQCNKEIMKVRQNMYVSDTDKYIFIAIHPLTFLANRLINERSCCPKTKNGKLMPHKN